MGKAADVRVQGSARPRFLLGAAAVWALGAALVGCSGSVADRPERASDQPRPGVRYVSPDGNDRNPGSYEKPLRTIGTAAKKVRPGEVVRVRGGTYDERVTFSRSGTASEPITIEPHEDERVVVARGFRVVGDHLVIRRLTVTPGESRAESFTAERSPYSHFPWTTGQVQIVGSHNVLEDISVHDEKSVSAPDVPGLTIVVGSENTVRRLDLHDVGGVCIAGAESGEPEGSTQNNRVLGGTVHHTRGMLFNISADRTTIAGVDMHDPGQVGNGGNAADGINLAGSHITIRDCRIYNILRRYNVQHTDAIQWWNNADDLMIEGNVLGSYRQHATAEGVTHYDEGHIQWETYDRNSITGAEGVSSHRVTIQNNVFINAGEYYAINAAPQQIDEGAADDWRIVNNTFRCPQGIREHMAEKTRGWIVAGNLFCSDGPDYGEADWLIDYNAYTGAMSPNDGPHSLAYVDPMFVRDDISKAAAWGRRGDWRLKAGSPLIGAAAASHAPKRDKEGRPRQGGAPDIGAYEHTAQ